MKKVLIVAVFIFTAMSFINVEQKTDKILPEDCMELALNIQAYYEDHGMSTSEANEYANVAFNACMSL